MGDIWQEIRDELSEFNTTYEFLNNIAELIKQYPDFNLDCLSKGQLYSKLWIIKELKRINCDLGNVGLLCGWYAILANMLFDNFKIESIKSFDIDPDCEKVADELNISYVIDGWKFKSFTADINTLILNEFQTVINLSCEHLPSDVWFDLILDSTLVVLQSNNYIEIDDHINCIDNQEDMLMKYPLSEVYYIGELDLNDYKRFMLIGKK